MNLKATSLGIGLVPYFRFIASLSITVLIGSSATASYLKQGNTQMQVGATVTRPMNVTSETVGTGHTVVRIPAGGGVNVSHDGSRVSERPDGSFLISPENNAVIVTIQF